jgi:DNA-binding LytR/AlgR family response regulator
VRSLGEVLPYFQEALFVRVHRSYAVNAERVAEVRRRDSGRDWELRLEPPVNRVLPVSRACIQTLWAAYGETRAGTR